MDEIASYSQDTKDCETLLVSIDRIPIAGEPKDAPDLFRMSTVWLDTYGNPKLLLWATSGFRVAEEGARVCAEKLRHAQIVEKQLGAICLPVHNLTGWCG